MFAKIKKIYNPELYHGSNKTNQDFFEGWYFKFADKELNNIYAIIPGVFSNQSGSKNHSFIQILDGVNNKAYYLKYAYNSFNAAKDKFLIKVDKNIFSNEKIILDINDKNIELKGKLSFQNIIPWPVKLFSPGAMGWYGFLPFMECNHGVLSFNHKITGDLLIDGQKIDFSSGKGYIEKDWGTNFPSAWIWLQTNHFHDESSSLMVSIATIPWLTREFRGFIIGFYHQGQLYKFTTYNNSQINTFEKKDEMIRLEVENKKHILKIETKYTEGSLLKGPYRTEMIENVEESLNAEVKIVLKEKENKKIITEDIGVHAGFELNGNIAEIIDNYQK